MTARPVTVFPCLIIVEFLLQLIGITLRFGAKYRVHCHYAENDNPYNPPGTLCGAKTLDSPHDADDQLR